MNGIRLILAVGLLAVLPSAALARRCGGVAMSDTAQVDGQALVLNGMGIREATVFNVDVYVAGLYLPVAQTDGNAILQNRTVRQLTMRFVRNVEAQEMGDAIRDSFGSVAAAQSANIQRLVSMLPQEIADGQTLSFVYRPGTGLEVIVNRQSKGTISGDAFSDAFFRIFLGPNPPNRGLKRGLLGGSC